MPATIKEPLKFERSRLLRPPPGHWQKQERPPFPSRRKPLYSLLRLFCRGRQLLDGHLDLYLRLVQHDGVQRTEFADPWSAGQRPTRVGVAGMPATANARRTEVYILEVAFIVEPWREQPHHMHARRAAVGSKLAHQIGHTNIIRHVFGKLGNDMA